MRAASQNGSIVPPLRTEETGIAPVVCHPLGPRIDPRVLHLIPSLEKPISRAIPRSIGGETHGLLWAQDVSTLALSAHLTGPPVIELGGIDQIVSGWAIEKGLHLPSLPLSHVPLTRPVAGLA